MDLSEQLPAVPTAPVRLESSRTAMRRIHTSQLALAFSVAAATLLAATVVLWGSEYKCSLYHQHPPQHARIATAKLLSENERPEKTHITSRTPTLPTQAMFFPVAGPLFFSSLRRRRMGFDRMAVALENESQARRVPCLIHFAFRPPPPLSA
jgi:hypothetical protein